MGRSNMRTVIAIIFCCATLWTGCTSPRQPTYNRESIDKYRPDWLPATAQMIFSSRWEDSFLGDGTIKVKARVTEAEFAAAVQHLGLTPHTADRKYTDDIVCLQWMGDRDERWDPSSTVDRTFVRQEHHHWQLAKYENGFLYYQSLNH